MANPSLAEYLAQSQRGLYQSVFGPDYLMKTGLGFTPANVHNVDTGTGIFTATYGRKVWQALNNQTRFFNAVPRVVWGNTAGWRVRTDRGNNRSRPVTETGALPDIDISDIQTISSLPRIVATDFGASVKSVFTSQLEGGVGDVLALENENAQLDHVKEINEELLAGTGAPIIAGTNDANNFTVAAELAKHFKIGDKIGRNNDGSFDLGSAIISGVTPPDTSTGVITLTADVGAFSNTLAEDGVYITSRAGFTSIDDIVADDSMFIGGNVSKPSVYDLGARTRAAWNAAASVATTSNGVGIPLTASLIDTAIQKVRENGGEPKLILLGHDQYFKLQQELVASQRYMGQEEYQVGVGSERTFPGTRTGMVLATYMGIPILPDADVPKMATAAGGVGGSNVYVLDTDYMEIAVAQPTQYIENRDFFAANALVVRGLLYTMGELRCKNIFVQAKIGDLA